MKTLIKNGTVATASDTFVADVLIEGEKISLVGTDLSSKLNGNVDRTIDAAGKYVIPGGIDPHTHLDMPFGGTTSADDFETGTRAAAFGGTTSVVDFAIQPPKGALRQGLDDWHKKAQGKACVDYAFHMIMRDVNKDTLGEMDTLVKNEGVPSFKLFTAYPGVFFVDDAAIFRAMQRTGENGGLICMHAENGPVIDVLIEQALAKGNTSPEWHALTRPPRLEGEATNRVIALAEVAGVPVYVVHLSAKEALEEVREARDRGVRAYAETCPQYLFLSHDNYREPDFEGAKYVMSPPLRFKGNEESLWQGLKQDDLALVATDHCPFCFKGELQKELGKGNFAKIPNGAPGIETRMSLLWDGGVRAGRIDVNRFVQITSTAPAKIFGLYPRKGTVAPGADADVVVFDPEKEIRWSAKSHHMRVDYNPYEGRVTRGAPAYVFSRGELIVEGDQWRGKTGHGKFIKRAGPLAR
ncbi:MAG TPA: dihydropyrimidinase [Myxococcales bacterium]|nr:dihydropyrimidinase [Myxococcales bacterium]